MNAVMPLFQHQDSLAFIGPVQIADAKEKGRGCFATALIKKGDMIERSQVIVVPLAERELIDKTKLYHYYYAWAPEDEGVAISLGFGSIYNHSYKPNAIFNREFDRGVIEYVALRDIQAGEEITVNYNGEPDDQDPLPYFEVRE